VEVVLAVFGIGTAITAPSHSGKGGLPAVRGRGKAAEWLGKFANWFQKFGKLGRGIARVADFFGKGLRWLVQTVEKFATKLMELGDKLMAKFKQIFANLEKKIDDIVARMKGKVDDVNPHGQTDDVLEHADDVPGGKRPKTKEDLERKAVELPAALALSAGIAMANDKFRIPVRGTIAQLKAEVMPRYRWIDGYEAKLMPGGGFELILLASTHTFLKGYFGDRRDVSKEKYKNASSDFRREQNYPQMSKEDVRNRYINDKKRTPKTKDPKPKDTEPLKDAVQTQEPLKHFPGKVNPDIPLEKQLAGQGQLRDLHHSPNTFGESMEELLKMTPRQVEEHLKGVDGGKDLIKQISKAFEGRDLGKRGKK
jgi:hypothetical protein